MWSEELQQITRESFERFPVALMKHFGDMKFGFCVQQDNKYIIKDMDKHSDDEWIYDSMDEMLSNGWAVD